MYIKYSLLSITSCLYCLLTLLMMLPDSSAFLYLAILVLDSLWAINCSCLGKVLKQAFDYLRKLTLTNVGSDFLDGKTRQ